MSKANYHLEGYKLISYTTHVATLVPSEGIIKVHGWWSVTTSRHINKVAKEWGLKKVDAPMEEKEFKPLSDQVRATALIATLGDVLCETQEDKNTWKKRMLSAGIPGIDFPSNWDQLSEDEKARRLDGALAELK